MPNTLGSGTYGAPAEVRNLTSAGVATRVLSASLPGPTDADWGSNTPPDGTMVAQQAGRGGILWVRINSTWVPFLSA